VIPDWEYRTAYIELFQVRMPSGLHKRLCEWAEQERKSLRDLVIEVLEEGLSRRHEGTSA
jgi:predicted HicB family RNase H-like nuclease